MKAKKVKLKQVLGNRVAIECDPASDRTPGGLYLPDKAKEKPRMGKVVAVGHGQIDAHGVLHKPKARVGDTVLFMRYGAAHVDPDDDTLLLVKDEDVYAVVEVER